MLRKILILGFIVLFVVLSLEVVLLIYHPAPKTDTSIAQSLNTQQTSNNPPDIGINPGKLTYLSKTYENHKVTFARVAITDQTKITKVIKASALAKFVRFYKMGLQLEGYPTTWYFSGFTKVDVEKLVNGAEVKMNFDDLNAGDSILFTVLYDLGKKTSYAPIQVKIVKL